jgi:exodeoxyribonuclease III
MTQVVSWNVNSIKSRLQNFFEFVDKYSPDIILLQELKCLEEAFPRMEIEEKGYNLAISGQKTYNGVAILSKSPIEDICKTLPGDDEDTQARYIEGFTMGMRVSSVYVPNGQEVGSDKFQYKLRFFDRLNEHVKTLRGYDEQLVIGGDYNVAPEPIDVYNPKALEGGIGFHIEERKKFRKLINNGMADSYRILHPNKQEFSWWDYRSGAWDQNKGMRIDQILLSPQSCDKLLEAGVYNEIRGKEKASDHAPIFCKFL